MIDETVPEVKKMYELIAKNAQGLLPTRIPDKPATFSNSLEAYVGEYTHPYWGDFEISLKREEGLLTEGEEGGAGESGKNSKKNEALTFRFNGFGSVLEHYHNDSFVATLHNALTNTRALISFSFHPTLSNDSSPHIEGLYLQELLGEGLSESLFKKK